jgi:protein O-GlcNAcase / histone acetyltransferase
MTGVIEGFYGQPWTQAERFELFDWMAAWGLNTYLYAPKDDLKHRVIWRELYTEAEAEALGEVIRGCHQRKLRFIYALGPGLDIRYRQASDRQRLKMRGEQMLALGCRNFALLFDDIPGQLDGADIARWGSLAAAQSQVANELFQWTRARNPDAHFLFCPTPYCGRMAEHHHGGADYLSILGRELSPEIDIFWTGPEIISAEIGVAHLRDLRALIRRKPVIWDNLHANDYDGRRFYCGPYAGRPLELKAEVNGLLCNPNNEFCLNYTPLRTLARYVAATEIWDPRQAYLDAMQEWFAKFTVVGGPLALEDLILLGDCFYLPQENGPQAEALYRLIRELLATAPAQWRSRAGDFQLLAGRLRAFCGRLAELTHRPLFYALSRRVWELREELDLLENYVAFKAAPDHAHRPFHSDFHLPGAYRGGLVPGLQRLLKPLADGSFVPSSTSPEI